MLLKPFTTVAAGLIAASATTHAFLLPPEVSDSDISKLASHIDEIIAQNAANSQRQVVQLDCPGCPVALASGGEELNEQNHLELTFNVDSQRLLVNGFELYPSPDPFSNVFVAPQVYDAPQSLPPAAAQVLGYSLQTQRLEKEGQMERVLVDLQIIEIGNLFVNNIPGVHIELIKAPSGGLLIGNIIQAIPTLSTPMDDQKEEECTNMMCKWMAFIREKARQHKPCHGMGPGPVPAMHPGAGGHHGHHGPPHHGGGHHQGGPHAHMRPHTHTWGQLFKNIGSHILLPVLVGIVAGVTVSLVGMMVGTVIVSLWRMFFRRGGSSHHYRHTHHHRAARKETAAVEEEKSGLMENQDPPPSYEAEEDVKV
ncbi:hypothetical protein B0H66DRAFT_528281 [Apodospora peruviana]|uniref:DUF7728 domain-containing protein n=1 Tax=Apodospora peruviana TaxID=516989 RepID=A0AAE0IUU0_9PEZI|nr:hypothetical protein B0H66DRAFT_528281 [Apodospora peruviana]